MEISEIEAFNLLMRLKPSVADVFSLTPNHYIYAGPAGWKHFHLLLNTLLKDLNLTSIKEVNLTYA